MAAMLALIAAHRAWLTATASARARDRAALVAQFEEAQVKASVSRLARDKLKLHPSVVAYHEACAVAFKAEEEVMRIRGLAAQIKWSGD